MLTHVHKWWNTLVLAQENKGQSLKLNWRDLSSRPRVLGGLDHVTCVAALAPNPTWE